MTQETNPTDRNTLMANINIVLVAPEIPQNTGNIIRLCSNVGASLHLVEPLGFTLDSPGLRRAALDYEDLVDVHQHKSIDKLFESQPIDRIFAATSGAKTQYNSAQYELGDTIVFGSESSGLPNHLIQKFNTANRLRIPMMPGNRSLNLSNAAAIIVYEMWRQLNFIGAEFSHDLSKPYFS